MGPKAQRKANPSTLLYIEYRPAGVVQQPGGPQRCVPAAIIMALWPSCPFDSIKVTVNRETMIEPPHYHWVTHQIKQINTEAGREITETEHTVLNGPLHFLCPVWDQNLSVNNKLYCVRDERWPY